MAVGPEFKVSKIKLSVLHRMFSLDNFLTGKIHVYWLPGQRPNDAPDPTYVFPSSDTAFPKEFMYLRHPKVVRVLSDVPVGATDEDTVFSFDYYFEIFPDVFDSHNYTHETIAAAGVTSHIIPITGTLDSTEDELNTSMGDIVNAACAAAGHDGTLDPDGLFGYAEVKFTRSTTETGIVDPGTGGGDTVVNPWPISIGDVVLPAGL